MAFIGLHALQHRGQESAGIAVTDGAQLTLHKRLGLVSSVFDEETLLRLEGGESGRAAAGGDRSHPLQHDRLEHAAQRPAGVRRSDLGELMLGHNGNLTNARWLRDELSEQGVEFGSASDTEVLAKLIAHAPGRTWAQRVDHAFHRAVGAFTFTMLTETRSSPRATRSASGRWRSAGCPAAGGRWPESAALDAIGAQFVRDVEAGEVLTIDDDGVDSYRSTTRRAGPRAAVRLRVRLPRAARQRHRRAAAVRGAARDGPRLAREHPADADLVIAVPDSAIPAAIGYAEEAGLPYREGLIKSRYVGRTFIQPAQASRDEAVRLKFNPLPELLAASASSSSTTRSCAARRPGRSSRCCAAPAPPRSTSASTRRRCATRATWASTPAVEGELIAANHALEGIRPAIGADSLGYLSKEGMLAAVGGRTDARCTACFDGIYPTDVPLELDKLALERR